MGPVARRRADRRRACRRARGETRRRGVGSRAWTGSRAESAGQCGPCVHGLRASPTRSQLVAAQRPRRTPHACALERDVDRRAAPATSRRRRASSQRPDASSPSESPTTTGAGAATPARRAGALRPRAIGGRPPRERRLRVDPIACTGHGLCAELFPERVRLDDWGYPIVDGEPVPRSSSRTRAARRRPARRSHSRSRHAVRGSLTRPPRTPAPHALGGIEVNELLTRLRPRCSILLLAEGVTIIVLRGLLGRGHVRRARAHAARAAQAREHRLPVRALLHRLAGLPREGAAAAGTARDRAGPRGEPGDVFATGVWLLALGHHSATVLVLHKVAFFVWSGVFGVHFLAHLRGWVARSARPGARRRAGGPLRARDSSAALVAVSLGAGIALALALLSPITAWHGGHRF